MTDHLDPFEFYEISYDLRINSNDTSSPTNVEVTATVVISPETATSRMLTVVGRVSGS